MITTKFTKTAAATAIVAMLFGCSSAPVAVVPDGSTKEPVNNEIRVEQVKQQTQLEKIVLQERTETRARLSTLEASVVELKNIVRIALLLPTEKNVPAPVKPTMAQSSPAPQKTEFVLGTDVLQSIPDGVLFRQFYDLAYVEFKPALELVTPIREAALQSKVIDINAYTDSPTADDANKLVAQKRAESVRKWLIRKGVQPSKIVVHTYPAGNFLVDNATEDGKAKNRRVEVLFHGPATIASFGSKTSQKDAAQ